MHGDQDSYMSLVKATADFQSKSRCPLDVSTLQYAFDSYRLSSKDIALSLSFFIFGFGDTSAPLFFAKAEMGSNPISAAKNDVASLPSAACVRPATAQNTKHRLPPCFVFWPCANDLTPCRMALHFDYALRLRSNSVKTPGLYGYAGVVVHRSASLASMYSFKELDLKR